MSDPDVGAAAENPLINGTVPAHDGEPADELESTGDPTGAGEPQQQDASQDAANAELGDELTSIRALGEDR